MNTQKLRSPKVLIAIFIVSLFAGALITFVAQPSRAHAQVVPPTTEELQAQLISVMQQLIQLLVQQIAGIQAQLDAQSALQHSVDQNTQAIQGLASTTQQLVGGGGSPVLPAPVVTSTPQDPAAYPTVSASASKLEDGRYKIEWLATQRDHDELSCSSPQLGNIGTQGTTIRAAAAGDQFSFSCNDKTTFANGSFLLTIGQ